MKKLLIVALAAGLAGSASAAYVSPAWESTAEPWGGLDDVAQWPGGVMPSGSTTGLVSSTTAAAWIGGGFFQNAALRVEAPIDVNGLTEVALRGGTSGSGITTVYEIEDSGNAGAGYANLTTGTLTMWSQSGEKMEMSILSGRVEVTANLSLVSDGNGTINMRDGLLHAVSGTTSDAQFNMLAGGTGNVTVDAIADNAYNVNFETGNLGSFTLGSKNGGSAGGVWEWSIGNGNISIDGVTVTDAAQFSITSTGGNDTTMALIPEPATFGMMAMIGGGILFIRKRFMI